MAVGDAEHTEAASSGAASESRLEDRDGRGRARRGDARVGWIVAGAAAALGLVVLLFGGWYHGSDLEYKDLSYSVVDERTVTIEAQVTAPADETTRCIAEALSESYATVGWKVIDLEPGDSRVRRFTTALVPTAPATPATLRECWIEQPEG